MRTPLIFFVIVLIKKAVSYKLISHLLRSPHAAYFDPLLIILSTSKLHLKRIKEAKRGTGLSAIFGVR